MRFLNEHAFATPSFFLDTRILRRMEPEGTLRRIGSAQARILTDILDNDRLARLSEYKALAAGAAKASDVYSVTELLADVRAGIWAELSRPGVAIDPFRRALQRAYLAQADAKINPTPAIVITSGRTSSSRARVGTGPNTDIRALMRGELTDLDEALRSALSRAGDRETRLHILDARAEIRRILDPPR